MGVGEFLNYVVPSNTLSSDEFRSVPRTKYCGRTVL